jgi:citrate lyase gamma subunit
VILQGSAVIILHFGDVVEHVVEHVVKHVVKHVVEVAVKQQGCLHLSVKCTNYVVIINLIVVVIIKVLYS